MAEFRASGANDLMLSLKELEEIPDEVKYQMLDAGADVLIAAQKNSVRAKGLVNTGRLAGSIKGTQKLTKGREGYMQPSVIVYPSGSYPREARRNKGKGKPKPVRVAEVGFVQNFGAAKRGIRPKAWMDSANEQAAGAMEAAEAAVYDKWLQSKNL